MRLFCYARVSTDDQSDSIDVQQRRLKEFAGQADMEFGGLFVDENVSAYKVLLRDRPQGKLLWDAVGPQDMVAVTAQDRLFRDPVDAIMTFRTWRKLGISLYDMGKGRVIETVDDETMFQLLAVLSGCESRKTGERRRNINQCRRKAGEPYSFTRPWGWQRKKEGESTVYVPFQQERDMGAEAIAKRNAGLTYQDIALSWAKRGLQKPLKGGKKGWYHVPDARNLYLAALAGYPKLPRVTWKSADSVVRQCEEVFGATPIAS